jgi:hypothetical protein
MLLGILLASLRWLAHLLPDRLPLVVLVLFNGREQGCFLRGESASTGYTTRGQAGAYLILSKLGIMHVLVPVLLHTALCPRRERLCLVSAEPAIVPTPRAHTFAISAQLLPASRICFSRSSSAGVHGVFVRLFFAGGGAGVSSAGAGCAGAVAGWVGAGAGAAAGTGCCCGCCCGGCCACCACWGWCACCC